MNLHRIEPYFSVITIAKNNSDEFNETSRSVLSQTFTNFEWLIIDGSDDNLIAENVQKLQSNQEICFRIQYIKEPDNGIYDAMNKGLGNANGTYLCFMNSGDGFADSYVLQKIFSSIEKRVRNTPEPTFIYGDSIEDSHYKKAKSHKLINYGLFTHHQAMFYKKEYMIGLSYDLSYSVSSDYDLTYRYLERLKSAKKDKFIAYSDFAFCIFQSGGISQKKALTGRNEQFLSRKKNKACGITKNIIIYTKQLITWNIRSFFPKLFWRFV